MNAGYFIIIFFLKLAGNLEEHTDLSGKANKKNLSKILGSRKQEERERERRCV